MTSPPLALASSVQADEIQPFHCLFWEKHLQIQLWLPIEMELYFLRNNNNHRKKKKQQLKVGVQILQLTVGY